MKSPFGWTGKILQVDLATGAMEMLPTHAYAEKFIGGRGIAAKLYWDMVGPMPDAFAPENPLIIMTGPLAGTPAPACSRIVMLGTSPLLYPDQCGIASMGGTAAAKLKAAGFDGVVIRGRARSPVLLHIHNGCAELRDARDLWGLDIPETQGMLSGRYARDAAAMCIGPAAERLVRLSLVAGSNGSFAGHGFGAVWGSKQLKALVIEGNGKPAVARPEELTGINQQIRTMIKGRNLIDPVLPDIELVRRTPCHGCPAGCSRGVFRHVSGQQDYRKNCGSSYFYYDWDKRYHHGEPSGSSFLATSLCNRLGLCTQELTKMLPWIHRCVEEGLITERSSGLRLGELGSPGFFKDFTSRMLDRHGLFDLLAQGAIRAARSLGPAAELLLEGIVEGSGFSADVYSPRFFITTALFHATDNNPMPQLHEISSPAFEWVLWYATDGGMSAVSTETFRAFAKKFWLDEKAADFSTYKGKGSVAALIQNRQYAKETLVACDSFYPVFFSEAVGDHVGDPSIESRLLAAVTGIDMTEQQYYRVGERLFNLQRLIQAREGRRGREGDGLPEFNFTEPLEIDTMVRFGMFNPEFMLPGPAGELITRKGAVLDRDKFEAMLDEYYLARQWDIIAGMPTAATLRSLDLAELIEHPLAADWLPPLPLDDPAITGLTAAARLRAFDLEEHIDSARPLHDDPLPLGASVETANAGTLFSARQRSRDLTQLIGRRVADELLPLRSLNKKTTNETLKGIYDETRD
jgi:aldehyde:ferredoxin oxidoreductase